MLAWHSHKMKNTDKTDNLFSTIGKSWHWDDIPAFLAIAHLGTLTAAAARLQIGIATLSRRLERLESALGLALFIRQQSGYRLTEDGDALLEQAEAMALAAAAFSLEAQQQTQLEGHVRLATAENLASHLIIPALPDFQRQYPGLTVEIVTDINTVNLHRRDADLALRMVRPERGHVTLRRLGRLGYGLYGHSDKANRQQIIGWSEHYDHLPAAQFIKQWLSQQSDAQFSLLTSSVATQVAAAKAGLGVAVLPHFIAQAAGLHCLQSELGIDQTIYLSIQADLAHSPRIRVVADFISGLVLAQQSQLAGSRV